MIKNLVLISVFFVFCSTSSANVGEEERPLIVQRKVDLSSSSLNYSSTGSFHCSVGFCEDEIIRGLARRGGSRTDIYLLDASSDNGGWSVAIKNFIQRELPHCGKHFHVFNLISGNELNDEIISTSGNITSYKLNLKIENIKTELEKRRFNLFHKIDLITLDQALNNSLDPFGTLEDVYELLNPKGGMLLSGGFLFDLQDLNQNSIGRQQFQNGWKVLELSTAHSIFKQVNFNLDSFMLIRTNQKPLSLPLDYTEDFFKNGYRLTVPWVRNKKAFLWEAQVNTDWCSYYVSPNQDPQKIQQLFNPHGLESLVELFLKNEAEKEGFIENYKAFYLGGNDTHESKIMKKSVISYLSTLLSMNYSFKAENFKYNEKDEEIDRIEILRKFDLHRGTFKGNEKVLRECSLNKECRIIRVRSTPEEIKQIIAEEKSLADQLKYTLEWKVYDHDGPTNLVESLLAEGFSPEDEERVLVFPLFMNSFSRKKPIPLGMELVYVQSDEGLKDLAEISKEIGRKGVDTEMKRLASILFDTPNRMTVYVLRKNGEPVSCGRVHYEPGSEFAELAGHRTKTKHRRFGYSSLIVHHQLRDIVKAGCSYVFVDALPTSESSLLKVGFIPLTKTRPFVYKPIQ